MNLKELRDILGAEVLYGNNHLNKEIKLAYGSDLMSDVLTFVKSGSLLLTGLTNTQTVRTAEIAEIGAICFVNNKRPQEETIKLADAKDVPVLATKLFLYECCGRLYKKGLPCGNDSK